MTRRRWIADEVSGNKAALTGAHAGHLTRVLRARAGQEFDIVANGVVHRGVVSNITESRVEFDLAEEVSSEAVAVNLTLLLAVFKFDRMEWAIEKATELGASRIIPLIARRTDAHLASAAVKRVERWRRIAGQAAEQSRRSAMPEVADPMKLRDAANLPGAMRVVLSEVEQTTSLRDAFVAHESVRDVVLAIGPEGGWTQEEIDMLRNGGWIPVSLGPTILRVETAAIAATAITMSQLT
ncbi:MAG TPA: RsmE family RNA methyltransferase [Candidatus Sulfotelmatobacter sp.]|nr:RsmE family RNA methyltransferase [Candidatus Sulfotelmatobacter sp.]